MRRSLNQSIAAAGLIAAVLVAGALTGCNDEELVYVRPPFRVVDGTPTVGEGGSAVDHHPPAASPNDFTYSASIRVDVFKQDTVRKVDILWMVDNSPSMTAVQTNLSVNFAAFISDLANAEPPVDYQIGVITPDTHNEAGALRLIEGYPTHRFIACNSPDFATPCNIGSLLEAENAFRHTVTVGADGAPVERGLLAAHMALTEPMVSTVNAGFLRDDAALYVIFVSDEGDASCDPILLDPPSGDYRECTNYPACRCANDVDLNFGVVDYFVRFFDGLKGFGNEDMVKAAAIVGDDSEDLVLDGKTYRGCRNQSIPMHAVFAPRYTEVAGRTGGITVSICEEDYSEALGEIGFAVSGQRRDFVLSRAPIDPDQEPFRVTIIIEEDDRRTRQAVPHTSQSADGGWSYVRCESGSVVNAVRFHGNWVPPPRALVEIAYHVDAGGPIVCN